jgi:hypothetical protein
MFSLSARSNLRQIAIHIRKSRADSKAPKCLARFARRANLGEAGIIRPILQK